MRIRVAETINALLDISYHEYIPAVDGGDDGILYAARILIFVDVDLIVKLTDAFADFILLEDCEYTVLEVAVEGCISSEPHFLVLIVDEKRHL